MQQQKKMSLTQLTFIVAVNMMGSGIIMLPTNMAQVGAISLLSWLVTAIGSTAIAPARPPPRSRMPSLVMACGGTQQRVDGEGRRARAKAFACFAQGTGA